MALSRTRSIELPSERSGNLLAPVSPLTFYGALSAHDLFKCTLSYPPLDIPPQCHSCHISGLTHFALAIHQLHQLTAKNDGREGR